MQKSTRIKYAIQTLSELNQERGKLSKQLAALRGRCQLREEVIDNLYDYYDVVAGDYYAVADGLVRNPEAIEVLRDYMQEHYDLLDEQIQKMRNILDAPMKPSQSVEKLEQLVNFVFYMKMEAPKPTAMPKQEQDK